jgi:hypothetical protein
MKVTTAHLESIRNLLGTAHAALTVATREAREAEEERQQLDGELRSLQAGFDLVAAAFAQDGELEDEQLARLPKVIADALGWVAPPPKPAAA